MRFLVDLYRVIVLAALAAGVILASYLIFSLFMNAGSWREELTGLALVAATAVGIAVVLAIGLVATFISIHDRLVNLAASADRIADSLERIGNSRPSF